MHKLRLFKCLLIHLEIGKAQVWYRMKKIRMHLFYDLQFYLNHADDITSRT